MSNFIQTPLGSAIAGAIGVVVAIFVFGAIGWMDQPDVWFYLLGAAAGFVGGWVGAGAMARRRQDQ